jgi:hypothetical protein
VAVEGGFEKWNATLTLTSQDVSTAVLDIKIRAAMPLFLLVRCHEQRVNLFGCPLRVRDGAASCG